MSDIIVTYKLKFSETKLNEIARGLYGADEVVPGEPRPGLALINDWTVEARAHAERGGVHLGNIDTMPWQDADSCTVEVAHP